LQVFWQKDGERIDVEADINFIISHEGSLIVNQARLSDSGNYSCGAVNIAGRRLSDPATLTVYRKISLILLCPNKKCADSERNEVKR